MSFFMSVLLAASASMAPKVTCPERVRAVFDVGSGATKLHVAKVAVCPDDVRLIEVLDDQTSRDLALEASKSKSGAINATAMMRAVEVLQELKAHARKVALTRAPDVDTIEYAVAGTHAFRTASNRQVLKSKIQRLGVPMVALTQTDEALLGYEGAVAKAQSSGACKDRPLVVWDVGGGSTQLTRAGKPRPQVVGLALGAESYKQSLITHLKRDGQAPEGCTAPGRTPNPIGADQVEASFAHARAQARERLKAARAPSYAKDVCVIGIGSLHAKAVHAAIAKAWPSIKDCACASAVDCAPGASHYTRAAVACLARVFATKSDCDPAVSGPYSTTAASNLFLIHGFMDALGLDRVDVEHVNMGHRLVVDRTRLKFAAESLRENSGRTKPK